MNDVERELRELLERKAGSVGGVAPRLPEAVRKRGRRRQASTAMIGAFTVAAVALVSFAGLRSIDRVDGDGRVPVDDPWAGYEVFERTATIETITITTSSDWYLVNQWWIGAGTITSFGGSTSACEIGPQGQEEDCKTVESSPVPVPVPQGLPVFQLSNIDLGLGMPRCGEPLTEGEAVLYVAVDNDVPGSAESPPPWPTSLQDQASGPCGAGMYASFSAGSVAYLAWAGFGEGVSDGDRDELLAAFDAMRLSEESFQPPKTRGPAYVIAGGENAAGPWRLELRPSTSEGPNTNVDLHLIGAEGTGTGVGDFTVPDATPIEQAGGDPTFGAVTKEATGVELRLEEGTPPIPATLVPLPRTLAYPFDLFFGSNPSDVPATAVALGVPEPQQPTPLPDEPSGTFLEEVDHLSSAERWAPATRTDAGLIVMPITFPDGATAELVYPADLALESLNFYPDTYGVLDGKSSSCGWPVHASRYDPRGGWVRGDEPLDRVVTTTDRVVELWEGSRSHAPYNYLLSRSGSWNVIVPCDSATTIAGDTLEWAELVTPLESRDGLLVFEETPPLDMHTSEDGASVRLSGDDVVVDLSSGRPGCEQREPDFGAGDGVVQWCVEPAGGVYIYANAFKPAQESFLERLVTDLQIRGYRPGAN